MYDPVVWENVSRGPDSKFDSMLLLRSSFSTTELIMVAEFLLSADDDRETDLEGISFTSFRQQRLLVRRTT